MKKFLSLTLSLMIILSLAACGSSKTSAANYVDSALKTVNPFDAQQVATYWSNDILTEVTDETTEEFAAAIFQNMTYKINSSEETDSKATVNVTIQNLNMGLLMADVMGEYMGQTMATMFDENAEEMTDEELEALFTSILKDAVTSGNYETVEHTIDIELEQIDGEWTITGNTDELINAMMGDINSFAETLNESISIEN